MKNWSKLITDFLTTRKQSTGGYAEVTASEVHALYSIIDELIRLKWQADPDGYYPIAFKLIDRTRFESMNFHPIPHTRSSDPVEKYEEALHWAIGNLKIAADKLDVLERCLQEVRRRASAEAAR